MQRGKTKQSLVTSLWLSVLLHLILLLCFIFLISQQPQEEKKSPNIQVHSYVYKGKISPTFQSYRAPKVDGSSRNKPSPLSPPTPPSTQNTATLDSKPNTQTTAQTQSAERPQESLSAPENKLNLKSIMASSHEILQAEQRNAIHSSRESEPIYLVGEENMVSDPLIKLIGRALSAHFDYPQAAGELGITGRVIVGFVLHPAGHFTEVQILQSSNSRDLDTAALYAVNSAPTVVGADRFLSKPKFFVVGFIFR